MWRQGSNSKDLCRHAASKPSFPDGVRCDTEGASGAPWVGATNEDGVRCYTRDGELLGKIHIPETVANLCFGGKQRNRLYICGSTSLYAVYIERAGRHELLSA